MVMAASVNSDETPPSAKRETGDRVVRGTTGAKASELLIKRAAIKTENFIVEAIQTSGNEML